MLKKVLGVVAGLVLLLVIIIATRPDSFRVERKATINASPEIVFAQINDFHNWANWSPWDKLDPAQKVEFTGAPSGTGAAYSWAGNDKVGTGAMTITDSKSPSRVEIKLEFKTPFEATNQTVFDLKPAGAGTEVVWSMEGKNNFMAKAMSLAMNMDQMVGGDFEKGLEAMKSTAEGEAKKAADIAKLQAEADAKAKADAEAAAAAAATVDAGAPAAPGK